MPSPSDLSSVFCSWPRKSRASRPENDSSVSTPVPPSCGSRRQWCIALIDIVRPRQLTARGGSTRSSVETIVPGPAFQRNSDPGANVPSNDIDFTSGFH